MNQEQKIQRARLGGFYLLGVLLTMPVLLAAVWLNWHMIILWFVMTIFCFFVYRTFITNAYQLSIYALIKYWKVSKLHGYYDCRVIVKNNKWRPFGFQWSKKQTKNNLNEIGLNQLSDNSVSKNSQDTIIKQQNIQLEQNTKRKVTNKKLILHPKKEIKTITKITKKNNLDRQTITKDYLNSRESYKVTLAILTDKNIKQKWFEQFCQLIHTDYSKKLFELIVKSNQNEQKIVSNIQELFLIKIVTDYNTKIPQKLAPIHIDEAIFQIRMLKITGCLPWTQKINSLQNKAILNTLIELVHVRDSLDQILSTTPHIRHNQRKQLLNILKKQLQENYPVGHQLLVVLMNLYNLNVKAKEFKLIFPSNKEESGIIVIEKQVGGSFHADLQTCRENKVQTYCIKPGEENLWCLLGMAAQIYRLRL